MKAFLVKYKRTIIYWIVFSAIVLFFGPGQYEFYLDEDITTFKAIYLVPILVWIGIVSSVAIALLIFFKAKSLKQSAISFLSAGVTMAFLLFIFQNVFLGFSLFVNRQVKRDVLQKTYIASYLAGTEQTKENFFPYDLSTKHVNTDKKLIDKIYRLGLKQNDTVKVKFDKGLFGIAFQPKLSDR